jgi:hypothetical protein
MRRIFRRIHFLLNRRRLEQELEEENAAHPEIIAAEPRNAFGSTFRQPEDLTHTWGWIRPDQH